MKPNSDLSRPLAFVAVWHGAGIVAGHWTPLPLPGLWTLAVLALLGALFCEKGARVLFPAALLLAGWASLTARQAPISPLDLRLQQESAPVHAFVRGTLAETPSERLFRRKDQTFSRTLALIEVDSVRAAPSESWQKMTGKVAVNVPGVLDSEYFGGRRVEIEGVLRPPAGPIAPGLFDYRAYLRTRGIHFQLAASSTNDWKVIAGGAEYPPWTDAFLAWAQKTLAYGLPEEDDYLRLLWTMVLGWKTGMTDEQSEPFMQSGTFHVFAISGLHIALLALVLTSLLRAFQLPRSLCGFVVIPLLWAYTAATGWQSSAARATVMACIIIAGWTLKRPSNLVNSLCAAALAILAWDPAQLFQPGFQLSFLVVLGIALIVPLLEQWRRAWWSPDPFLLPELRPRWQRLLDGPIRFLLANLAVSLAATLASLPIIAYYFYLISPVSLLSNLLVAPLSGVALMASLGSLCCGSWLPWLTELFNHAAWLVMAAMVRISEWTASLPGAWRHVAPPPASSVICYYLLLGLALSGWWKEMEKRKWAFGTALALLVIGLAPLFSGRNETTLTLLPLRGSGLYFDAPGRRDDLLIDPGDDRDASRVVTPFLQSRGVNALPHLLLTHGDAQHVSGTEELCRLFRPQAIHASDVRFRSTVYRGLLERLRQDGRPIRPANRGDALGPWQVLHPAREDRFARADDGAVVLFAELSGQRILLLSDLSRAGQQLLLEREPSLRVDILILGIPEDHEPPRPSFLHALQPKMILVVNSAGTFQNEITTSFRQALGQSGASVYYTSETGALTLRAASSNWQMEFMDGESLRLE